MNIDLVRKTEIIRRKVKTILFDRKNRRLSDKMYDDLGEFFEKLNNEGVLISSEYYDKLEARMNKLQELNTKRVDELTGYLDKDTARIEQVLNESYQRLGLDSESDFDSKVTR